MEELYELINTYYKDKKIEEIKNISKVINTKSEKALETIYRVFGRYNKK